MFDAHAASLTKAHGASGRFAPAAYRPRGAIRPQCRSISVSPATPECRNIPEAAPGRRLPQAMVTAPAPDSRRLSGFPVWSEWLPTHRPKAAQNAVSLQPAPRRHQRRVFITPAAAALKADLAPRHYRNSATGSQVPHQRCDILRRPAVVTCRLLHLTLAGQLEVARCSRGNSFKPQ